MALAIDYSLQISRLPGRSCPAAVRSAALAYPIRRSHQEYLQRPGPACSTAVGRDFPGVHSRPASLLQARPPPRPLPVRRTFPLMPGPAIPLRPCPPVVRPGRPNLTKSSSLSLLTLHFPSGKALSPLRALATKSRG